MRDKIHHVYVLIATVGGLGYLPFAPGTWGSLGGLVLCMLLHRYVLLYVTVFMLLFLAGLISAGKMESFTGQKDPSWVVIDEAACMFPVFLAVDMTLISVVSGFLLFRIFDVAKPYPMRKIEAVGGGWGIMLDDLVAAVYSHLILRLLMFIGFI